MVATSREVMVTENVTFRPSYLIYHYVVFARITLLTLLELRPILPAATPLALLALSLAFLAVTPHAAPTNGKAPRS